MRTLSMVLIGLIGSLAGVACSSPGDTDGEDPDRSRLDTGSGADDPDAGASPPPERQDDVFDEFGNGSDEGPADGGELLADAACAATALEPELIEVEETVETRVDCLADVPAPINLYILLDNSLSMEQRGKWQDAVSAMTQFVQADPPSPGSWDCVDEDGNAVPAPDDLPLPESGDMSIAIQYFHPIDMGGGTHECNGTGHAVPAVSMGPLPENAESIIASLASTGPQGNTPTVGALLGGTAYCAEYQSEHPGEDCVVVLVTDGQPNACDLSAQCLDNPDSFDCVDPDSEATLTPIVEGASSDPGNSVTTFTVGMDGVTAEGFALLDTLAAAGGSDCTPDAAGQEACNVSGSGASGFLDALNTIRDSAQLTDTRSESTTTTYTRGAPLPCEWTVPSVPKGKIFDKDLVNVTITTPDSEKRLGRVDSKKDCARVGDGWYYDDPEDPSRLRVCPATCNELEGLTEVRVDVLLGCATEIALLR